MLSRALRPGVAVVVLTLASSVQATMLMQFNLKELATRADRVFRGRVVAVETGTVHAGGGDLPSITYRLKVDESFKGEYAVTKGDTSFVEIRMVGAKSDSTTPEGQRHFSAFREVPRLEMNGEYVLFTTRPSSVGLSTTVGLGQGAFRIVDTGKNEEAVNGFNNIGLKRGLAPSAVPSLPESGPISYPQLAAAIRNVLGK
jgi:hypothetical protein